jgi:PAS domain S-box-containing protein
MIPPTMLLFVQEYTAPGDSRLRTVTRAALVLGISFSLISLTTSWIFVDPVMTAAGLFRKPGVLYSAFASYFLATWVLALFILMRHTVGARGARRARLRYLAVAISLWSIGAVTTNLILPLLTGRSSYTWFGPLFSVLFLTLVAHAVIRHRLFDLTLFVHRSLTLMLATLASLGPAALLLGWYWSELSLGTDPFRSSVFLFALLVSVLLAFFMRDWIRCLLDAYVYRTGATYQTAVSGVTKALTQVLDLPSLLTILVDHIAELFRPEGVVIYIFDRNTGNTIHAHRASSDRFLTPKFVPESIQSPVTLKRDILDLDQIAHVNSADAPLNILLVELGWSLVLPLPADAAVMGVIAVGPKLSGDPYYPQDLDVLVTLANQAGIAAKNAELYAQIVLANEYIENIVGTISSGVIAVTTGGRVTLFNRAAERLTGLPGESVRRNPMSMLPPSLREPLARTVADGCAITCPEIALSDGETIHTVICTTSPLRDVAGNVLGGVAVFSDLSAVKELEIERRRTEKLAYFRSLASGFAHELKNPLVSIKTFAQLVPDRIDDRRWLADFSRIAHRELERIERLLHRLATLGRDHERPQRLLDLRLPIREALELLQPEFAERRISVMAHLGEDERVILGDHDQVKQLAHNLLANALQHTPVDGRVNVAISAAEAHTFLTVEDTGPGIPSELLEQIFEPFVTTRRQGIGLGLAICTGIAAAHRARLRAANHALGGATFTVEFPLVSSVPTTVSA